jgi:hypothetical protein
MSDKDFSKIPASACTLVVGEFELGENGENAKSAPMRLVARSGKAIEHPYWGRIVHDLAGMRTHKPRLPIDYVHDSKEVIGYLNKFDISSGDLVASGALVPFKDNDRATEVLFKSKAGVPYEASINFGGDGIKIEEVPEGFVTQVNGYELEGPAVVVREWPLRGVAVCPYGADMNTESNSFSDCKQYAATVITTEPETTTEESSEMSDTPVEVAAEVETPDAAEIVVESTEAQAVEVEDVADQPAEEPEVVPATEEPKAELSRAEFLAMVDEFGADIATETVRQGGDYVSALKLALNKAKDENKQLHEQVQTLSQRKGGTAAPVVDSKPKITLRTLCEQGASSQRK